MIVEKWKILTISCEPPPNRQESSRFTRFRSFNNRVKSADSHPLRNPQIETTPRNNPASTAEAAPNSIQSNPSLDPKPSP
jgi:hypothetical protein